MKLSKTPVLKHAMFFVSVRKIRNNIKKKEFAEVLSLILFSAFLPTNPVQETTTPMVTTTVATTQASTDPCKPNKHNEYLAVPGDCRSFYVCSFGTTYKFRCAGNTVFFQRERICYDNDGSISCWYIICCVRLMMMYGERERERSFNIFL